MKRILEFIIHRLSNKSLATLQSIVAREQVARGVSRINWADIFKPAEKKRRK